MKRIIVVGGGISGLSTAYHLVKAASEKNLDVKITLIESKDYLGGTILTKREDGFTIEGGPDCYLSEKPWAAMLGRELGLGDRIEGTNEENKGTFILSRNKLHPLPEGVMLMVPTRILPMATSSLLSWPGKIRMGLDLFVPRRKDDYEESLAEFVTRRLGKEALDKIAEPLVAGVHAGVPETMSLRASFPRFKQLEDEYGSLIRGMIVRMAQAHKALHHGGGPKATMFSTFRDGLGELTGKVKEKLSLSECEIVNGVAVSEVKRSSGGWTVVSTSGKTFDADAVVVATPAYTTANILRGLDSALADDLDGIPYVSTATASLAFDAKDVPEKNLKGFGFVVPRTEKRLIMAATWTSRKFYHRAPDGFTLVRCFLGGAHRPEMVDMTEDEIVAKSLSELGEIVGLKAQPVKSWVFKWPRSMPQTNVGHEARIKRVEGRVAALDGLEITGGAYYGLGIPDCVKQGQLAAERTIKGFAD